MRKRRRVIAALAGVVVLVAGCAEQTPTSEETHLAEQLQTELASQGVEIETDALIALYGDDGGHLCIEAEQGSDYIDATLVSHRFALRKTSVSSEDVAFVGAVIDVYCPEERVVFDEFVAGLDVEVSQ
jgi:hypothetical protein